MVDLGLEQGLSNFETAGISGLCRGFQKSENAAPGQKMPFVDGHYLVGFASETPAKGGLKLK
jgi:hypothetical protein